VKDWTSYQVIRDEGYSANGYSYEAIIQHLNQSGIPTAMGGKWQAVVVWGIVRRTQPEAARRRA
jgi:Recombinase